jgi:uncharacterized SAM-binding protein YcdF (DUF218 family)
VTPQPSTINSQPPPVSGPIVAGPAGRSPVVRCRKWLRRLLWLAVFCFLLSAFCFAFRSPILRAAANLWVIDDPIQKADAIVLLGGGLETRPSAAARLYRDGYAPRILITQPKASPTDGMGLTTREQDIARQVLMKEGVPESAITGIGQNVQSTYDESRATRAWLNTNHATRLIIPTDIFHTRRVRWMFHKQLKGTGVALTVEAVPVREYTQGDWWKHEQGIVAFQNELVKSLYYHLKY